MRILTQSALSNLAPSGYDGLLSWTLQFIRASWRRITVLWSTLPGNCAHTEVYYQKSPGISCQMTFLKLGLVP